MPRQVVLGASSHAQCTRCGRKVAYFSGDDSFISEVKTVSADKMIALVCPKDGNFKVSAERFMHK